MNKKSDFLQSSKKRYQHSLYPVTKPREERYLKVSRLHSLYIAQYGNPNGIPVIVLHGGPGAGCDDVYTRSFDLERWNVIMFDQRGSMRSKPFGCMEENTPQHSIQDIEQIRKHLGIKKWMVFGGSWGSTLSLLYGEAHPNRCLGFIVRGIFLARKQDYLYVFYEMGKLSPKIYNSFMAHIPKKERKDLIAAFYERIMDPDPVIHRPAGLALVSFMGSCWMNPPDPNSPALKGLLSKEKFVESCSKVFMHYSMHGFFLKPNQVLAHMKKMAHLPGIIIQGELDGINPPMMATSLHKKWKNSALWMIPKAGHSAADPGIAPALATATDLFANTLY